MKGLSDTIFKRLKDTVNYTFIRCFEKMLTSGLMLEDKQAVIDEYI